MVFGVFSSMILPSIFPSRISCRGRRPTSYRFLQRTRRAGPRPAPRAPRPPFRRARRRMLRSAWRCAVVRAPLRVSRCVGLPGPLPRTRDSVARSLRALPSRRSGRGARCPPGTVARAVGRRARLRAAGAARTRRTCRAWRVRSGGAHAQVVPELRAPREPVGRRPAELAGLRRSQALRAGVAQPPFGVGPAPAFVDFGAAGAARAAFAGAARRGRVVDGEPGGAPAPGAGPRFELPCVAGRAVTKPPLPAFDAQALAGAAGALAAPATRSHCGVVVVYSMRRSSRAAAISAVQVCVLVDRPCQPAEVQIDGS